MKWAKILLGVLLVWLLFAVFTFGGLNIICDTSVSVNSEVPLSKGGADSCLMIDWNTRRIGFQREHVFRIPGLFYYMSRKTTTMLDSVGIMLRDFSSDPSLKVNAVLKLKRLDGKVLIKIRDCELERTEYYFDGQTFLGYRLDIPMNVFFLKVGILPYKELSLTLSIHEGEREYHYDLEFPMNVAMETIHHTGWPLFQSSEFPWSFTGDAPYSDSDNEPQVAKEYFEQMNRTLLHYALESYAKNHEGHLPPHRTGNIPDENGIYPHSWRVYLLPYVTSDSLNASLYKKIRLNEPWDSEWNRQFHQEIPLCFRDYEDCEDFSKDGNTRYCLVVGGEIPADGPGADFQKIKQHQTVMIAKSRPGCWMDPNHDILAVEAVAGLNQSKHGIHVDEKETAWPAVLTDGTFREFPVKESSAENLRIWLGVDK